VSEGSSVVPVPGADVGAPAAAGQEASPAARGAGGANGTPEQAPRHPSFYPGARIAKEYVVERLIGEGKVGVVVAAKHVQFDQNVAIKYLRRNALVNKVAAERFLREARLAARVQSEHIVHVYDVGALPDGAPYIVMECLSGTDLGRLLTTSGPLPVDRAVDYVLQACEGLAQAHAAGVVHRDIRPANLFLSTSFGGTSVVKVLDFGMWKTLAEPTTSGGADGQTAAGDELGTPAYMSPEQILASGNVDARTDVWAIGVVLYELLTGALPFEGESPEALRAAVLHGPPMPLLQTRPELPVLLEAVVEKCLAKEVEKRFQNIAELVQELRPLVGPAGRARIEQVARVIPGAGRKARAPSRSPVAPPVEELRETVTPEKPADRSVAATESSVASWSPMTAPRKGVGHDRRRLLVAAGASVVAAALAVVALAIAARSSPPPAAEHPALLAASSEPRQPTIAPTASAPPAPEEPAPTIVAAPPIPTVAAPSPPGLAPAPPALAPAPPVVAATPSAAAPPPPSRSNPHRAPKPGVSSPAKGVERSSHADPNAVINPFE